MCDLENDLDLVHNLECSVLTIRKFNTEHTSICQHHCPTDYIIVYGTKYTTILQNIGRIFFSSSLNEFSIDMTQIVLKVTQVCQSSLTRSVFLRACSPYGQMKSAIVVPEEEANIETRILVIL